MLVAGQQEERREAASASGGEFPRECIFAGAALAFRAGYKHHPNRFPNKADPLYIGRPPRRRQCRVCTGHQESQTDRQHSDRFSSKHGSSFVRSPGATLTPEVGPRFQLSSRLTIVGDYREAHPASRRSASARAEPILTRRNWWTRAPCELLILRPDNSSSVSERPTSTLLGYGCWC